MKRFNPPGRGCGPISRAGQWWQNLYEEMRDQPCIADFIDLSPSQIRCADVILLALAGKNGCGPISNDVRKILWDLVFNFPNREWWNTIRPIPVPELPGNPTYKDISLKLGYFKKDLLPGTCPHGTICQTALCRRKFEPAFLRPKICANGNEIDWIWTDSVGELANSADVQPFYSGVDLPLELAQAIAIWHRDEVMGRYAAKWNREQAVYWARCCLVNQACEERRLVSHYKGIPTADDLKRFKAADFCEDIARRSEEVSEELKQHFDEVNLKEVVVIGNAIREEMGLKPL